MDLINILVWIIVGAIAGWLASIGHENKQSAGATTGHCRRDYWRFHWRHRP